MNKIVKIIQREYLTRVRKKSFIIMTILGPILFAGLMLAPVFISKIEDTSERQIAVIDSSSIFDYSKILKEVTLLNTYQLRSDLVKINSSVLNESDLFKDMAMQLDAIVVQRDENMVENIKITIKNTLAKLQLKDLISFKIADSIYNRHALYYEVLIREFESIRGKIPNDGNTRFVYIDMSIADAKKAIENNMYYAVVFIPQNILASNQIQILSKKSFPLGLRTHITGSIERAVENHKMIEAGINIQDMSRIKTKIHAQTIQITESGETKESRSEFAMMVGYISGFLIYFAIFVFGSMVMRGIIEEKSSRIVEVILSSVKPIEIMFGKIIGVGLVGITQFALWIVITFSIVQFSGAILRTPTKIQEIQPAVELSNSGSMQTVELQQQESEPSMAVVFDAISSINFPLVLSLFLFYFIGGFLLYGAMFAAVGSAVDSEADTQQFMMPITIPLIVAIIVMVNVMNNPDSNLAYWFSIIPFTSPVIMMVRLPFGVPVMDVVFSMLMLIGAFLAMAWIAAKIYRTGILFYGSKASWKDLWKWMKH
ncbi:MAG TPA: ABC transporter permease [Salinivirgaceae bacterium]|nr:ABC transporter permease [Salinivirgaceae bacterium]